MLIRITSTRTLKRFPTTNASFVLFSTAIPKDFTPNQFLQRYCDRRESM